LAISNCRGRNSKINEMQKLGILPIIFLLSSLTFSQGKGVGIQTVLKLPDVGKRWALIIGVDNYEKDITPLYGSVNDAKALKEVLIKYAGFPANQVILMTTDAANRDLIPNRGNILDQLDKLSYQISDDSLLLFSFSGHGVSIGNDAFLIPSDGRIYQNPELLRERSIDVRRVKQAIQLTRAKQVLMFLDACRNDPLKGRGDAANPLTEAYKKGFSFELANKGIEAFATIYATSIGDRAYEFLDKQTQQYRGFFSYAIEEALSGKASDEKGEITLGGVIKYLENNVRQRVQIEKGQKQVPYYITEGFRTNELILSVSGSKTPVIFENTILQGEVSFNYEVNKPFTIGKDEYEFKISWTTCSTYCIWAYSDYSDGVSKSRLKSFESITDVTAYDMSSRARLIDLNEVVIFKNKSNYYVMVQVLKVSPTDNILSIRYKIIPNQFQSTWKYNPSLYVSKSKIGKVTFDTSNNNHWFTIGENDYSFITFWSNRSVGSAWFSDFGTDIDYIATVNDSLLIKNAIDASRYKKNERSIMLGIGNRGIIKNKKGKFAIITLIAVDSKNPDVITFEYEILPD
jgi:hypothetical protein